MSYRLRQSATACLSLILLVAAMAVGGCVEGESDGSGGSGGGAPGALAITTTALPGDFAGQAYSQLVTAGGGSGTGYTWSVIAGALPVGVSLTDGTPSATLSGNLGAAGTFNFTLQVTDDALNTATMPLSIVVTAPTQALAITTNSLPGAALGVSYGAVVSATGGSASGYTWTVISGALPNGVSLNSGTPDATLSGAPTAAATANFTLQVTDSAANTATRSFTITFGTLPLVITTTSTPNGTLNHFYTTTLTAAGGSGSGYTWSVIGGTLPAGLSLTGAGTTATVSGTPTAATGSVLVTYEVQDSVGGTSASVSLYIAVLGTVQIVTTTLPAAPLNQSYLTTVYAGNGTGSNFTWSITSGSLPPGLSLSQGSPGATIDGTATTAGSYPFTIEVNDNGDIDSQALTLVVSSPVTITTTSLANANSGVAYSATITATGGTGTYTWGGGPYPAGLSLTGGSPSATLSGTTVAAGVYSVYLYAQDTNGMYDTAYLSLTVTPGSFQITTTSLPDATIGAAYNQSIQTTGGTATNFSVIGGSLPGGLSLSAAGVISGSPGATGMAAFTVQADEAGGATHFVPLSLTVLPANTTLTVTTTSLPDGTEGSAYSAWLTGYGGTNSGYTWSVASGALPLGVSISADQLTGTPTENGTFNVTLELMDSGSNTAQASLSLVVHPPAQALAITTTSLPDGIDGQGYNEPVSALGGTPPYNWSVSAGSLPTGTALHGGTPTAAIAGVVAQGNYAFTLQVQDSAGLTATQALAVVVSANSPLVIDTDYLVPPTLSAAYTQTITASGGTGSGYTWTSLGGDLPFGLSLASGTSATLSGTPTVPGAYRFAVKVSESSGASYTRVYTLTVYVTEPLKIIYDEFIAPPVQGQPWSVDLLAEGGTGTGYNWGSTSLPAAFTLTPNGASATLATSAWPATVSYFTVDLTDSGTGSVMYTPYSTYVGTGQSPQVFSNLTTGELPGGSVGKAWELTVGVRYGSGSGYAWSIISGALPPGIALHTRGTNAVLEGVPLVAGDWYFTLLVTDGGGSAGISNFHFRTITQHSIFAEPLGTESVFVLDRSGSMGGSRHYTLRTEVENTVLQMEPGHSLDIVTFESVVRTMWGQLKPMTPANRAEALAFAHGGGLAPAGATATYPALELALTTYPTTLDSLVLMTDGSPNVGGSATQVLADFPGWFAPYTACDFIGVGMGLSGTTATFMQMLAQSVGGVYVSR